MEKKIDKALEASVDAALALSSIGKANPVIVGKKFIFTICNNGDRTAVSLGGAPVHISEGLFKLATVQEDFKNLLMATAEKIALNDSKIRGGENGK